MDKCLYSRNNLQHVHRSFLFNDFNKEYKTGAYSFYTSSFSIAVVSFSSHFVLQIISLHFHTVILFTLFCGLTF